jgi:hypothetical protein
MTEAVSGGPDKGGADTGGAEGILDAPQHFSGAGSYQVRDELQALIERDLLGPWDGDTEVLPPRSQGPGERYLVGRLGPHQVAAKAGQGTAAAEAATVDAENAAGGDGADPELPDLLTMQNAGRMWASSMGLSCMVDAGTGILTVTVTWGQYAKAEVLDDAGNPHRQWSRQPIRREIHVRLTGPGRDNQRIPLTSPSVYLAVAVRDHATGRRVVEIGLVNAQEEPPANKDVAWLFQPKLAVTALIDKSAAEGGERAAFCPIDDPLEDTATGQGDGEDRQLRLLYRNQLRHAVGRNVAVHASVRAGERCAHRLETTWLPAYEVPATIAPPAGKGSQLEGLELSMEALARAEPAELAARLSPLAAGYAQWLDERAAAIPALPAALRATAQAAVFTARQCATRLSAGIELLTSPARPGHEQAVKAFRFANQAMALQRQHTTIAALRETTGASYADARAQVLAHGATAASWRPFQLAFVLLNLPALTDPAHLDRDMVDLLFFPTGGGKTEAYLGLAAYTFAIRRLQRASGSGEAARDGSDGVGVLMRYTLRLLTAQQFQRAAALVCAAEVIRRGDEDSWGRVPFRIGMWVGGSVSPNWYSEAAEQITDVRDSPRSKRTGVLQTLVCPWCGTKLAAQRDLRPDDDRRRVLLYCPSGEGGDPCPFSEVVAEGEGLPILTVDEEIYRYLPSLVIATVDKLAQLPWHGYAGMLFGRVSQRCPRHGYRHDDMDERTGCRGRHHKVSDDLPATASQPVARLRPPDLIIQDELHLISGALGTTVGLFEAAVDELCGWPRDGARVGPKIVASTATTKRATAQAKALFGRGLAVFPPPVLDVEDTFFSRQVPVTPQTPGRRYLGVCAHGVRLKSAEIRLAEILLIAGQTLLDAHGEAADPYMTVVGYFNATRELAGMRRYLDDDVTIRVRRHGHARGMSDRLVTGTQMLEIEELTSRISSADISSVLKRLESGFTAELDTAPRRKAIATEFVAANKEKRQRHPLAERFYDRGDARPVDVVLATSMLQVGVDVARFGLVVVTGQPKNTAEYIQASSRVGRDARKPGLVVTLYNWSRPRDLAHYEDFEHYHATFYRQVEALSVTPYTRRALDRGTAATFVAAVRNVAEPYSRDADAQDVDLNGQIVEQVIARLLSRAERAADQRGRDYLAERIAALRDRWTISKTGATRLGYRKRGGKEPLNGLLAEAGGGPWTELTVSMSMRETENEVNLLVPGTGLFAPQLGQPAWSFAPPSGPGTESDAESGAGVGADDVPDADELGESSHG